MRNYVGPPHSRHNGSNFCVTDDSIHVWIFSYIYLFFDFLLGFTLSTFSVWYLVEGGAICNVYMCFQTITTSRNFTNKSPCNAFVSKYASICCVLQYVINMLPLSTRFFTKQMYINVPLVTCAKFLPIILHFYCNYVILE